ncbi:MAG: PEGA domain-containing protein [Patescibacteria group bacterium]
MRIPASKGLFYTLFSGLIIIVLTYLAINYAKGSYRITDTGLSPETGLLAANSFPPGSEVYINDKLVTATDDTLYLDPGEYRVRISQDGYSSWQKTLTLEKELVTQTNAKLFPSAPSITPLTFTGTENILPSPDGQKIVYYTASNSAQRKNGLYLLELADSPLSFQRGARQIAEDSTRIDLATASFIWSPDSTQLMIISPTRQVLIDVSKLNNLDALPDISFSRKQILNDWEEEMYLREKQFLAKFPDKIISLATQSAVNVYFSPNKKRLLYTATADQTLPENLAPPLPAASTQPQVRQLVKGGIYVYDQEEDRNFQVGTAPEELMHPLKHFLAISTSDKATSVLSSDLSTTPTKLSPPPLPYQSLQVDLNQLDRILSPQEIATRFNTYHSSLFADTLQWYPDSNHLIYANDNQIKVMEYDSTNVRTLYSGPFTNQFIYPWPDGSRLLITTNFTPQTPVNLYAIELK